MGFFLRLGVRVSVSVSSSKYAGRLGKAEIYASSPSQHAASHHYHPLMSSTTWDPTSADIRTSSHKSKHSNKRYSHDPQLRLTNDNKYNKHSRPQDRLSYNKHGINHDSYAYNKHHLAGESLSHRKQLPDISCHKQQQLATQALHRTDYRSSAQTYDEPDGRSMLSYAGTVAAAATSTPVEEDSRSHASDGTHSLAHTDPYNIDELDSTSSNLLLDSGPNSLGDFESIPVMSSSQFALRNSTLATVDSVHASDFNNPHSGNAVDSGAVCDSNGSEACTVHVASGLSAWGTSHNDIQSSQSQVTEISVPLSSTDAHPVNSYAEKTVENQTDVESSDFLTLSQSYPGTGCTEQYMQLMQGHQSSDDNPNKVKLPLGEKLEKLQLSRRMAPNHASLFSVSPSEDLSVDPQNLFNNERKCKPPLMPTNLSNVFNQVRTSGHPGYRARVFSNPGKKPTKERRLRSFSQTRETNSRISLMVNPPEPESFLSPTAGTIFTGTDANVRCEGGAEPGSHVTHITIGDPPSNRSSVDQNVVESLTNSNKRLHSNMHHPRETLDMSPTTANNSNNGRPRKRSNSNRFYV